MSNKSRIDTMMQRLGDRDDNELRGLVVQEVNYKLEEMERAKTLFWFLEAEYNTTTSAGVDYITLPTGFIREVDEGLLEITVDNGKVFPKKTTYEQLKKYQATGDTVDVWYAIFSGKLYIYPTPEDAFAVYLPYFAKSTPVKDTDIGTENIWFQEAFNFICYETLKDIAVGLQQSPERAVVFGQKAAGSYERLYAHHIARQATNNEYPLDEGK